MTHRNQKLSDQLSRLQSHEIAKEDHHALRARTDLILKNLLVFGSMLLVVSVILYLIIISIF